MRYPSGRLFHALSWRLFIVALLLTLAGCTGKPTATPAPAEAGQPAAALPSSAEIRPEEGGTVALAGGAEVSFAAGAVTKAATVSLRMLDKPPAVPVPRSLIGRAYQVSVEGGDLIGVARVMLPLPANVTSDAYDLAPYRWTGEAWERLTPRLVGGKVQFGISAAAIVALQGQWRLADASLALAMPASEPGRPTAPIVAVGQYRYLALPALQGEYVSARLTLKRDSTGGAGQVRGDEAADETVAETELWFKPDPARPQAVIEFSYVFEVKPGDVKAPPASVSRLYAVLTVEDSAAPTRRLGAGIEYTQLLPIQVSGAQVVRPELAPGKTPPLRWNVRLNGYPLLQKPATELSLSLPDVLAEGGLGDYQIILEAELDGKWVGVSNEVTVQLRLPATATPSPTATRPASATPAISLPGGGTATPGGPAPATPTRRPTPSERTSTPAAGPSPTATSAVATVTPTPTRPAWASVFWADHYTLEPDACTTLHWNVENVTEVYLDGVAKTGSDTYRVCPTKTTTYTLRVVSSTGTQELRATITVQAAGETVVQFTADSYEIVKGKCTTLRWRATNVTAVFLSGQGVAGEASKEVCPDATTEYELRVEAGSAATVVKKLIVTVLAAEKIAMRFWAEQYTMEEDGCTTLHWNVQDVEEVYLTTTGAEEGVAGVGTRSVCPGASQFYTLRAVASDDRAASKQVNLKAGEPILGDDEVIAQGIVNEVTFLASLDALGGGNQPGWQVTVDGVNPLFTGVGECCQTVVKLLITKTVADAVGGPVDWPINPGQFVEFRAACTGEICTVAASESQYVRLRSD